MKAFLILAALCVFAFALPSFGRRFFDALENRVVRLANSRWSTAWLAIAVFIFSVALTSVYRLPQPRIHDEFSYLLQSDTFAHGRLTNPTHPLWRYFETLHVLQQPTYASKYQPGQGLFLALGQIIWNPILGVWISTALAIASLFWMLRALFSPGWALAGAVLAFLNTQVLWWNWSFWGGCVPMLGGALVLGGMFRTLNNISTSASVAMGIGAGLLVITRPFEGGVLCLIVGIVCLWSFWKTARLNMLIRFATPLVIAALPFLAFDAYYNYRVTGNALTPPYATYEKTYSRNALFIWQADPQNDRNHRPEINRFYDDEKRDVTMQRSLRGFIRGLWTKLKLYDRYFLHGLLALLVIPALFRWRIPAVRICFWIFVSTFAVVLGTSFWAFPHYSAPSFPAFIALVLFGLACLHRHDRSRLASRLLYVGLCAIGFLMFATRLSKDQSQWQYRRADLIASLTRTGKKHLVLVKYAPDHNRHNEWIYNSADIDSAPVVFAPDGDPEYIEPLLSYFKNYQVIHIEPDRPKWGD
jgi:ABC-type multidrug transport system fused ATPase/permease subunit